MAAGIPVACSQQSRLHTLEDTVSDLPFGRHMQ